MGDEMHNRNKASNSCSPWRLPAHRWRWPSPPSRPSRPSPLSRAGHFILNSVMPSCKAMLDAGAGIPDSTVVTTIARNGDRGRDPCKRPGRYMVHCPGPKIEGVYFPGFGPDDANPDIGDSAIAETMGLGSCAMAAAPAIVQYVGDTPEGGGNNHGGPTRSPRENTTPSRSPR